MQPSANKLRQLLARPAILVILWVYDCLAAKIVEQLGFEVLATSGFGIAASTLGLPDYGFLTATEMVSTVGRIAQSVSIPLIADMDTGYGNALNVIRTIKDPSCWRSCNYPCHAVNIMGLVDLSFSHRTRRFGGNDSGFFDITS